MSKVMRADRTVCEIPDNFMFDHGSDLGYAQGKDGMWVPTCDLEQYNAGNRRPNQKLVEVLKDAVIKTNFLNIRVDDLVAFSLDYNGKIVIHLSAIPLSIAAVNAIAAGVKIEVSEVGVGDGTRRHVSFERDGLTYLGIVESSVVEGWEGWQVQPESPKAESPKALDLSNVFSDSF